MFRSFVSCHRRTLYKFKLAFEKTKLKHAHKHILLALRSADHQIGGRQLI